ncbi:helix-turn-helix transcriptional regulator [Bdellovibrio sp. NC01]|uniref:helix-turn-helix domain-containing protein n=1 Tax=Bdellovibrio sp. NC01 TaxID=2220073 RepID=UPI00115C1208|nr:helix-turn-helix transcriptional regulator [Bdellovibrio sp. NC01]QDK38030.1 LuxR family transcriptional regulator [Bdellovibrio sp. NC01]
MNEQDSQKLSCLGEKLGVCIKDQNKTVLFQNGASLKMCGNLTGQVCGKACMKLYHQVEECSAISQGMKLFKNTDLDGSKVDAMIVNDGNNITTFLYPLDENQDKYQKQEEYFVEKGLTKSEIRIMQMVLQGMTNAEIAEKLFISKATLKTHLNNAYKKLPSSIRPSQLRA